MTETRHQRVEIRRFRDPDVVAVQRLVHVTIDACYPATYPTEAVQFFMDYHG